MTSLLHLLHLDSHYTMIVLNDVKIIDLGLQCMVIFSVLGEVLGPAERVLEEFAGARRRFTGREPWKPHRPPCHVPSSAILYYSLHLCLALVLLSLGFILAQLLLLH